MAQVSTSTPHELFTSIRKTIEHIHGFEGSDQQRQLDSLLIPVPESALYPRSVQSLGRLEDEYELGRVRLGEGRFAIVNTCCHRETRKMFAVKMIYTKPHLLLSASHRRLTHEIKVMERLVNHHNIIEIKRAFFDHHLNSISIVMDFASQGSLDLHISNRLRWNPLLDVELDTRQIVFQVCKGLGFIHAQGIVHCDIKPANILLTADTPPVFKIADFGSAQWIGSSGLLTSNFGTLEYMAPERASPRKANGGFNDRADCWSVGAIVFNLLTGRSHLIPFPEGLNLLPSEIISAHQIDWDLFNMMKNAIHPSGETFVGSLLEHAPTDRLSMTVAMTHAWFQGLDTRRIPTSIAVVRAPTIPKSSVKAKEKKGRKVPRKLPVPARRSPHLLSRKKKDRAGSTLPRLPVPTRRSSRLLVRKERKCVG